MNDINLTPEQQKQLDDWYFENPYCTHAAWLNMAEQIKGEYKETKDDGFFFSLKNKMFFNENGINKKFYVFGETDEKNAYLVNTFAFEIVRGFLMGYRASCMLITIDNYDMFRDMEECDSQYMKDFVAKYSNSILSKIK